MKAHPIYIQNKERWLMAYDFYAGGQCVLSPTREIYQAEFKNFVYTSSIERILGTSTSSICSYLHRHQTEDNTEFEERKRRQIHIPIFRDSINRQITATLRTDPVFILPSEEMTDEWKKLLEDLDLCGNSIKTIRREILQTLKIFGRVHILIDAPQTEHTTQQEAIENNSRPYATLLSPLDVIDWETDNKGNLLWVIIRETNNLPRLPFEDFSTQYLYRLWTPSEWFLYNDEDTLLSSGIHSFGKVPLLTLGNWDCESPLADVLDLDRHFLNKLSDLDTLERHQAFSILSIPVSEGQQIGPMEIGPTRAIAYSSEAGEPSYLSPDANQLAGMSSRVVELINIYRSVVSIEDTDQPKNVEIRSAAQIAALSITRKNQYIQDLQKLEQFENSLYQFLANLLQIEIITVSHSKVNDLLDLSTLCDLLRGLENILTDDTRNEISNRLSALILHELGT